MSVRRIARFLEADELETNENENAGDYSGKYLVVCTLLCN